MWLPGAEVTWTYSLVLILTSFAGAKKIIPWLLKAHKAADRLNVGIVLPGWGKKVTELYKLI